MDDNPFEYENVDDAQDDGTKSAHPVLIAIAIYGIASWVVSIPPTIINFGPATFIILVAGFCNVVILALLCMVGVAVAVIRSAATDILYLLPAASWLVLFLTIQYWSYQAIVSG
jgi:hypothetical protein